jgi:hypothetical protein
LSSKRYLCDFFLPEEANMPVLLIPVLVGIPVVLAGGYYIIHAMH